ncbi:MAG: T9SS type A sorting domain-containing protein [Ferruginibacter sp.]
MKIFLHKAIAFIIIGVFLTTLNLKAQGVFFADNKFQNWIVSHYPSCIFPDNSIDVTCSAIVNEDTLDLSGTKINDYDGLQYFPSLRYLDVSNNYDYMTFVQWSFPNAPYTNLKTFICLYDPNIPWNFPHLEYLDCRFTTNGYQNPIPGFPATLKYLDCSNNGYYGDLYAGVADTLICRFNAEYYGPGYYTGITGVFPSGTLKYLDCSGNILTSVPMSPSLTYLNCSGNILTYNVGGSSQSVGGITSLPTLGPNLKYLDCSGNYISSLPALPASLENLLCDKYGESTGTITSLPALPQGLRRLSLRFQDIPSLPSPLPDSLRSLVVYFNSQLQCLPHLPSFLNHLDYGYTNINCIPNSVNGLTGFPLCKVTNNSNFCVSNPVLSGHVFYDNNSNGTKEANENYRAHVGIQISNGLETFSNTNGYYEITADTGANTLTVLPPVYYDPVPATALFNMPAFTSVASQDIALQPNASVDALTVSVTPAWFARPGGDQNYDVEYENTGTTTLNPSTVLHYDNTRLVFLAASVGGVIDNGNSLSYTQTTSVTPGDHGGFTALFHVKETDVPGDTIFVNVATTGGSVTVTDSAYTRITASFDPNDKYATPKLTPQQVASGTYINYLIRFQNTGNDTAFNVVLTDILDGKLDASSLQMIKSSHPCKVTRNGSNLSFEFMNILLPYQSQNEALSHGYVRFRVKPNPSVVLNDVIPNSANIYFDFNSPVLTNTANTFIQLNTVPLHLLSFKVVSNNNNNEALLYWNTANELNSLSFDIEQSIGGRIFTRIGSTTAFGSGDNTYSYKTILVADVVYYRLKMIDVDGRFTYSQVIQLKRSKQSESITVLTNPTKNTLSIITTDAALLNTTASIINQQGVVVKRFVLNDGLQHIDVSNLSAGAYYFKTSLITKKIVINH